MRAFVFIDNQNIIRSSSTAGLRFLVFNKDMIYFDYSRARQNKKGLKFTIQNITDFEAHLNVFRKLTKQNVETL